LSRRSLLFDASSVFMLVRDLGGKALDLFRGGSTISLVYYEVGNALWRECFLLNRIDSKEAADLLQSIFPILRTMDVSHLEDEVLGDTVLSLAGKLNITYYDAAYLAEAQNSNKTLVTDDGKLVEAAEGAGVKTLTSKMLRQKLLH